MRFLTLSALIVAPLALAACGTRAPEDAATTANDLEVAEGTRAVTASAEPTVTNAWIRLPAVPGRPAAAYFTLVGGAVDDAVVSVATPAAKRTELHESMEQGGVMSMERIENVPLGSGAQMDFAPGGKHVMLFDVSPELAAGGTTQMMVSFQGSPAVTVEAALVAPGGDAPAR